MDKEFHAFPKGSATGVFRTGPSLPYAVYCIPRIHIGGKGHLIPLQRMYCYSN